MMKMQRFGVEIELTGITRTVAANTIAKFFGATAYATGDTYNTRTIKDPQGRIWKVMRDASVRAEPSNDAYKVEIVSPILVYEDIETIQEILRLLRKKGAKANDSCGIHIHVDGANHSAGSLKNIIHFMCARQDLVYEALAVKNNRLAYCKKLCKSLFQKVRAARTLDIGTMENLWYGGYSGRNRRYDSTRYHCINIHSFFYLGTVEFRMFNSTTHAGELKAYIQFCLAVSAWAASDASRISFRADENHTASQKVTLMNSVLTNRLGLTGKEFKTARLHLTKHLERLTA